MSEDDEIRETLGDKVSRIVQADDPYLELMAERWHEEQRTAGGRGGPPWLLLSEEARDAARGRAAIVLAGEVPWSSAGVGDRAIWAGGRQKHRSAFERAKAALWPVMNKRAQPSMDQFGHKHRGDVCDLVWWNLYDTLVVNSTLFSRAHVFNNANVGNTRMTNLMCGGFMPMSIDFFAADFYATVRPLDTAPLPRGALDWIDSATACLVIGEKRMTPDVQIRDLLDRVPVDSLIRSRDSFKVQVDSFRPPAVPFEVVFHLDGGMVRSLV